MVLDGLHDVAQLQGLQGLLRQDRVEVMQGHQEVVQVALTLLKGCWVPEDALVVGDGPLGGAHNSEVVVHVGVQGGEHGVLGTEVL